MKIIGEILQLRGLEERPFTDRNGQPQMFASFGLVVGDGLDRVACEATGQYARQLSVAGLSVGDRVTAHVVLDCREWTDSNGKVRYENTATLQRIAHTFINNFNNR